MVEIAFKSEAISQWQFASSMDGLLSQLKSQRTAGQELSDNSGEICVDIMRYFMDQTPCTSRCRIELAAK